MKRRGGRVVSSSSTVVGAAGQAADGTGNGVAAHPGAAASPTAAYSRASSAPQSGDPSVSTAGPGANDSTLASASVGDVAPTLVIPTLDIFARFQGKRDDFDAEWLMLQEDPAARDEAPPIAAHVAEKLRRHQAQLGAHRAAAAERARQDRVAAAPGSAAASTVSGAGLDAGATAQAAARPPRRPRRRPDAYDSAEEEGEGQQREREKLDDEDDYVPEDRAAAQYAGAQRRKAGSDAPPTEARRARTDAAAPRRIAAAASAVDASTSTAVSPAPSSPVVASDAFVEAVTPEAEEAGLVGDYLNFAAQTGSKSLDANALQATVQVPGGDGAPQQQHQQQQRRHQQQQQRNRRADRVLVVPLWSSARVTQHGGYCRTSPLIALHQEVLDLVDYLRPTEAEVAMRRYIEKEVGRLVDRLWPGSSVLVYGSMYTHLLLPLSDLDMTLVGVPVPPEEALTALAKEVSNAGLCENAYPQVILKTKVPLIKFVHKGSFIDVDISVGALDGKRNSDCVLRYLRTYPEALPLTLVVKYFVMQRGMHEPYHGGLGSYAATLLVVAFLRQHPIYTTQLDQRPMTGLGKLLVDFFRMCGQYWSFGRVAVCLEPYAVSVGADGAAAAVGGSGGEGDFRVRVEAGGSGGSRMLSPTSPSSPRGPLGPTQACIEDPVDPANNAASSLRLFHAVASMFANAYYTLTADFESVAAAAAASPTGSPAPQPGSPACSPSSEDISSRPTLLSRIFHVDADMVYRRQAVAATYERLCREMPAYMQEVREFHAEEDAAMLQRNCGSASHSWAAQRLQLLRCQARGGNSGEDGSTSLFPQQRPVTSLEERLALSRLHTSSAATSVTPASPVAKSQKRRREHEVASSSSSRSSSSSTSLPRSDSGSNASSVRVDVSRTTERRRRLRR